MTGTITSTSTIRSYTGTVVLSKSHVTITIPTESRGDRRLSIPLNARYKGAPQEEIDQLDWLIDGLIPHVGSPLCITLPEMQRLASLAARCQDVSSETPTAASPASEPAQGISPLPSSQDTPKARAAIDPPATIPDALTEDDVTDEATTLTSEQIDTPEQDARERLIRSLKSASEDRTQLYRIVYYIPSRVSNPVTAGGCGMFADVALRMRRAGTINFDGSTYVAREGHVPQHVFDAMDEWNARPEVAETANLPRRQRLLVKWRCEKIHPEELERTRLEAFEHLRDHVIDVQDNMLASIDRAAQTLAETESRWEKEEKEGGEGATEKKISMAQQRRNNNVGAALSVAKRELEAALQAAELFDESEALEPLFAGLRSAMRAHHAALVALRQSSLKVK